MERRNYQKANAKTNLFQKSSHGYHQSPLTTATLKIVKNQKCYASSIF